MEHLTSAALEDLFSPIEIVDVIRLGILKYAQGKYRIPERQHLDRGTSINLIMPAFGTQYYCTKLISVDKHNHLKNLPVISGILVLNDNQTGQTLVTMDAPMITALRTAAVGVIGLDLISKQNEIKLGIIGLGVQGFWQTMFIASTKILNEIFCFTRSFKKFSSYKNQVSNKFPNIKVTWCSTAEDVVKNVEIIVTCTTSNDPVFDTYDLDISEKRFISVGSFTKHMQELPEQVYRQADALIIDAKSAEKEVGDVINAIKNNWIEKSNIFTLADILGGKESIDKHKNIVFKSVGMAAFDLALAVAAYEKSTLQKT
jgi:ornithine cyclodeaminase/alanine dehydrogenase-like protein (mu-crystallin family)